MGGIFTFCIMLIKGRSQIARRGKYEGRARERDEIGGEGKRERERQMEPEVNNRCNL